MTRPVKLTGPPAVAPGIPVSLAGQLKDLVRRPISELSIPVNFTGAPVFEVSMPVSLAGRLIDSISQPIQRLGDPVRLTGLPMPLIASRAIGRSNPVKMTGLPVPLTGSLFRESWGLYTIDTEHNVCIQLTNRAIVLMALFL